VPDVNFEALYIAAAAHPMVAKSFEEASRLVGEATQPTLIRLPSNTLGREHQPGMSELVELAIHKGVAVICDEADFIETSEERATRLEKTCLRGRLPKHA